MVLPDQIPVFILSGFLGAGKSTLLNELLEDPSFHDTAVIINEFGDIPVDHLLVRQGETTISQVSTGCLCCSGSTDLIKTLFDLHFAAYKGQTTGFSRVILEMSGLGDPAPLVNALNKGQNSNSSELDHAINNIFYLAGFVTLFDMINGANSVEDHFEALKQIAFADKIVVTKTDRLESQSKASKVEALLTDLSQLNTGAEIIDRSDAVLSELFTPRPYSTLRQGEDVIGWLALEEAISGEVHHAPNAQIDHATLNRHASAIQTFSIISNHPIEEKRLHQFLAVLQSSAGQRLLRVKGIVSIKESPDQPLIIHAVQHVVSEPLRLAAWQDDDRRTRLVLITYGIDPEPVRELFSIIINNKRPPFGRLFQKLSEHVARLFNNAPSKLEKSQGESHERF